MESAKEVIASQQFTGRWTTVHLKVYWPESPMSDDLLPDISLHLEKSDCSQSHRLFPTISADSFARDPNSAPKDKDMSPS
jgi:hypothetical protein